MFFGQRFRPAWIIFILTGLLMLADQRGAFAQPTVGLPGFEPAVGSYPSDQFYTAMTVYRDGDLERAMDLFDLSLRQTRRDVNGRWIDAIPVYAMLAECHWHAGNLPACQANLDQVFQLVVRHDGWLRRIDWGTVLQSTGVRSQTRGLWPEAASIRILPTSRTVSFRSGEVVTEQRLAQGGAIESLNIKTIDAMEIFRGLSIAAYRRRVVLGDLANQDPLATEMLDAIRYPKALTADFGKSIIGSMRSAGKFSMGDDTRGLEDSVKYASVRGGFHELSTVALLTQTSIIAGGSEWERRTLASARVTANVAAATKQPELIGEALQLAAGCATPATAASVQAFAKVAAASMTRESRLASLHCLIAAADAAVTAGDVVDATSLLRMAQDLSSRRDVVQPRLDAYGAYVSARLAALQGDSLGVGAASAVGKAVGSLSAFAFQRKFRGRVVPAMPRVYQLQLLVGGGARAAGSDKVIRNYCISVPGSVWRRDPVDGLAASMMDRNAALMSWLRLAANDSDGREFLERLDHVLARRFLSELPIGGRVAQVRQLAGASEVVLPESATKFVNAAAENFQQLRRAAVKPVPADLASAVAQSDAMESSATRLALDRLEFPRVIPPPAPEKSIADLLPSGTALLTFTYLGKDVVGTVTVGGRTEIWRVGGASRLTVEVSQLLRKIGVGRIRGKRLPEDESWKEQAAKLEKRLFPDGPSTELADVKRVVVVPDGALWAFPFELLPLGTLAGDRDADDRWVDKFEISYAPTPGSAIGPVAMPAISRTVAMAANGFFVPRDSEANEAAVTSVMERLDDSRRLTSSDSLPGSLLGDSVGTICVAAARGLDPADPFAFRVAAYDAGTPLGSLRAYMRLPAASPRVLVLSGFRSSADSGQTGNGNDMFMTLCGLNAAGIRDVMISRWAVGGQSTATMLSELLPEIPHGGLVAAWARARTVLADTEIDPSGEPLLTQAEHDRQGVTGALPLFWAGYMVASPIDLNRATP